MTPPRFFCPDLHTGTILLSPAESRHALQVLRLRPGAALRLFDGKGRRAVATICDARPAGCAVEVDHVVEVPRPAGPAVTLVTALPRAARQQFLFEKCTELGVARIVAANFAHSVVRPKASTADKWRQWMIEAAKQSGCLHLPELEVAKDFAATLTPREKDGLAVFGSPVASAVPLADLLPQGWNVPAVRAWIGPEGGLSTDETEALGDRGAIPVRIGPHVLRIETAAIALAAAFACR